jgi:hypothetical protein
MMRQDSNLHRVSTYYLFPVLDGSGKLGRAFKTSGLEGAPLVNPFDRSFSPAWTPATTPIPI